MPDTSTGSEYEILEELAGSFFGKGKTGESVLLVPTSAEPSPSDRSTGGVSLSFSRDVRFDVRGAPFTSPAAILGCGNDALLSTFRVLARDVAERADARTRRPSPRLVSQLLSSWEQLLRARRVLSRDEEVGLWGELWTIHLCPDADTAVTVWRGPDAAPIDFVGGGIGIECKTTLRRLEHHVSQAQVDRPLGDLPVFLLSLWVDQDDVSGKTINGLVGDLAHRVTSPLELEKKLLAAGYSRADAHHYGMQLRHLEAPLWFPVDSVPRVRAVDAGVSDIRFTVSLEEAKALPGERGIALLAQLCGARAEPSAGHLKSSNPST